jgi:hypothetical protein
MRDIQLEEKFQKQGYIEIPWLSAAEVEELKQVFFDLLPASGGNITASDTGVSGGEITYDFTFIDRNIAYKEAVFRAITDYFKPHVAKWLNDYRPIIANYIRKKNEGGEVPLHQNWAFVDEEKCTSVSIWCPLVDSFEENGTLQVVPGSHKRFGQVRGPMIPWELEGIKGEIINKHLLPLNVKAGNAIVLDDSIVHYSAVNRTNGLRLAIQLILIPEEVPSIHYHMNTAKSQTKVEVLEVDTDFYMKFNPWMLPVDPKVVREFDYTPVRVTGSSFEKRLSGNRIDEEKAKPFIRKVMEMFTS